MSRVDQSRAPPAATSRRRSSPRSPPRRLTAWDRVKLARHPDRPHTLDYIGELITDFVELHGDRAFGDDQRADRRPGRTSPAGP